MIDHLHNGYVAQYKSPEDFANGIYWTLTEPDYPQPLGTSLPESHLPLFGERRRQEIH